MDLSPIGDAFDRVTKKQKLSTNNAHEMLDQMSQELVRAIESIESDPTSPYISVLHDLKTKLQSLTPQAHLEPTQKELNIAFSKYTKLLEKTFNPDISKAYRDAEFDSRTLNQIIAAHFYRQGMFEIGDGFVNEANIAESTAEIRALFWEMYSVLAALSNRNLNPALRWASENHENLKSNGSDLPLKLHRLQFMEVLQKGSKSEALAYARKYMAPFAEDHFAEFQKDMGCLLFAGKLEQSPYAEVLSGANWRAVAEELVRQFCSVAGQSYGSPLGVVVAAGFQGLPSLLKFMSVMAGKRHEWQAMKQLPVPVELHHHFQFHSVFVCPVSKEQASDDNPAMLMSCGHVLCKQSISKMSKNATKAFKCPYCPSDVEASLCKQLYF